jgi:hypothetical protein
MPEEHPSLAIIGAASFRLQRAVKELIIRSRALKKGLLNLPCYPSACWVPAQPASISGPAVTRPPGACLLLPSLNVHAHHEEP